jgi:hypothetical protein
MSVKVLGKTAAERPSGIKSQDRIPDMIFRFLIFQWFHQFKTAGQQFFLHPFFHNHKPS